MNKEQGFLKGEVKKFSNRHSLFPAYRQAGLFEIQLNKFEIWNVLKNFQTMPQS